ncbi:MAG TPA: hypothetical protein VF834_23115 [Streptosporangiaceae bacterium]
MPRRLAILAVLCLATTAAASAPAVTGPHRIYHLCYPDQILRVTNRAGESLVIRNDVFGADHECLLAFARTGDFVVSKSTATAAGSQAVAFPSIFYGCVWAICSTGSKLPEPVTSAMHARTSWVTQPVRPAGTWNTAYDIWFFLHRHPSGQANGAELMIWLNTTFPTPPRTRQVVRIGMFRYWFQHWRVCRVVRGQQHCWNYIQFRRIRAVSSVRDLELGPFIAFCERLKLIRSSWWLANVEAGWEIWKGGTGLRTMSFSVRP